MRSLLFPAAILVACLLALAHKAWRSTNAQGRKRLKVWIKEFAASA